MYIYRGMGEVEISAEIWWMSQKYALPCQYVYWDRWRREVIGVLPEMPSWDNVIYDPTRYKFILEYKYGESHEKIREKIHKMAQSEFYQAPIRGSLTSRAGIIQRNWQDDP